MVAREIEKCQKGARWVAPLLSTLPGYSRFWWHSLFSQRSHTVQQCEVCSRYDFWNVCSCAGSTRRDQDQVPNRHKGILYSEVQISIKSFGQLRPRPRRIWLKIDIRVTFGFRNFQRILRHSKYGIFHNLVHISGKLIESLWKFYQWSLIRFCKATLQRRSVLSMCSCLVSVVFRRILH